MRRIGAIGALTAANRKRLKSFLASPEQPEGTLSYHEVQGFLFAMVSAPELVRPSEWLPVVFGGGEPVFDSRVETERTLPLLLLLFNEASGAIQHGRAGLPRDCPFRASVMANLEPDAPVSQWSRGFVIGHAWLKDVWDEHLPPELGGTLGSAIATLSFFASPRLAKDLVDEFAPHGASLEAFALNVRRLLPQAAAEYADIGRGLFRRHMGLDGEDVDPLAAPARPNRNDPCPCGSGRKYKRCCGAEMH